MQDKELGFELVTLGHLLKRERDRANDEVKRIVLGPDNKVLCTDLGIIRFLAENTGKEIYQKDIEQFLFLTAPSVSNKLRGLEKKGLINRIYSKTDTRLKQVIMTEKAWDIDRKMRDEIGNFENRVSNLLSDDEKDVLVKVINKLKSEFE
jgi:DNA-binding MarR family transcriptional regulator